MKTWLPSAVSFDVMFFFFFFVAVDRFYYLVENVLFFSVSSARQPLVRVPVMGQVVAAVPPSFGTAYAHEGMAS